MSGNFSGAIQYKIDLKHSVFTAPMFKKIGDLKYTAGMNSMGLIGYWKFDEGNGTVVKDWCNDNNGITYNGSTTCSNPPYSDGCPVWVDGKFGRALGFDGVDDYVKIGSIDVLKNQPFSIEVLVKTSDASGIMVSYENGSGYYGWRLSSDSNGITGFVKFGFVNASGDWVVDVNSSSSIADNKWHHVVGIDDSTNLKIYIDGKLDGSSISGNLVWDANMDLFLGVAMQNGGINWLNGSMDEVRIYNRELSEEEIKENYNSQPSDYQIVLEYNKILLTGKLKFGKGTHKLCVEKLGEINNKPLIRISVC
jgi:hypothetical protein